MRIPLGRLIWVDSGTWEGGCILWMVVRGPYICGLCGGLNHEWFVDLDNNNLLTCGVCGLPVNEWEYAKCGVCGDDDWHGLRIVANNNFGISTDGLDLVTYNDKKGKHLVVCGKDFCPDRRRKKYFSNSTSKPPVFRILSPEETIKRKRKLVWTGSDEYQPGKKMPDWVIEMFPDGSQE